MTTSLKTRSMPRRIAETYLVQIRHLHARRTSAALIFAQETAKGNEDAAASAFADYYEASVEHQLLWSEATREENKVA